jgi:hypothetical protein
MKLSIEFLLFLTTTDKQKMFETAGLDIKNYAENQSTVCSNSDYGEVGLRCSFSILAPKHINLFTWFSDDESKDSAYKYNENVLHLNVHCIYNE